MLSISLSNILRFLPDCVRRMIDNYMDKLSNQRGDNFVSKEEALKRITTCSDCMFYDTESKRCGECGCKMTNKVKYKRTPSGKIITCPHKFWKDGIPESFRKTSSSKRNKRPRP